MKTLLLLSLLLASPALARIGETREQCEARYGKPVKVDEEKQAVYYEKAGFKIRCGFFEGRCEHIAFNHANQDAEGKPAPLSAEEMKMLMESNSGGRPWSPASKDEEGIEIWRYEDLEAAFDGRLSRYLSICTQGFLTRHLSNGAAKK